MTFIVRLSLDEAGRVTGVVERVRTGEKERFEGVAAIATLSMVGADHIQSEEEENAAWITGQLLYAVLWQNGAMIDLGNLRAPFSRSIVPKSVSAEMSVRVSYAARSKISASLEACRP